MFANPTMFSNRIKIPPISTSALPENSCIETSVPDPQLRIPAGPTSSHPSVPMNPDHFDDPSIQMHLGKSQNRNMSISSKYNEPLDQHIYSTMSRSNSNRNMKNLQIANSSQNSLINYYPNPPVSTSPIGQAELISAAKNSYNAAPAISSQTCSASCITHMNSKDNLSSPNPMYSRQFSVYSPNTVVDAGSYANGINPPKPAYQTHSDIPFNSEQPGNIEYQKIILSNSTEFPAANRYYPTNSLSENKMASFNYRSKSNLNPDYDEAYSHAFPTVYSYPVHSNINKANSIMGSNIYQNAPSSIFENPYDNTRMMSASNDYNPETARMYQPLSPMAFKNQFNPAATATLSGHWYGPGSNCEEIHRPPVTSHSVGEYPVHSTYYQSSPYYINDQVQNSFSKVPKEFVTYGDATPSYVTSKFSSNTFAQTNDPLITTGSSVLRKNFYSSNIPIIPSPQEAEIFSGSEDSSLSPVQLSPKNATTPVKVAPLEELLIDKNSERIALVEGIYGSNILISKNMDKNLNDLLVETRLKSTRTKIMQRPIKMCHINKIDGKEYLKIDEMAIACLLNLGTKKVSIVCVCGELGSGKSFLGNILADCIDHEVGFQVGNSTRPCTDGIWMWPLQDEEGTAYLLLDFEGIGDTYKSQLHEQKLFNLAMIIANCFLYVSKGAITANSIKPFSMAHSCAQQVQVSPISNFQSSDYSKSSINPRSSSLISTLPTNLIKGTQWKRPLLYWVIRDFNYILHDQSNLPISSNTYLEAILKSKDVKENNSDTDISKEQKPIFIDITETRNISQDIKLFFDERECVTLPAPSDLNDSSVDIKSLTFENLSYEFRKQAVQFKNNLFKECKNRSYQGFPLTGSSFSKLLQRYVDGINESVSPPSVISTWETLLHEECSAMKDLCFSEFIYEIRNEFQKQLPLAKIKLENGCRELKKKFTNKFKELNLGNDDIVKHYRNELKEKIDKVISKALDENDHHAEVKLNHKFTSIITKKRIEDKLSNGDYVDIIQLEDDLNALKMQFERDAVGPENIKDKVLSARTNELYKKGCEVISTYLREREIEAERARFMAEDDKNASILNSEMQCQELQSKLKEMEDVIIQKESETANLSEKLRATVSNFEHARSINEVYRQKAEKSYTGKMESMDHANAYSQFNSLSKISNGYDRGDDQYKNTENKCCGKLLKCTIM